VTPGLTLTLAESLGTLADVLSDDLVAGPSGPLEAEWVVVASTASREWFDWLVADRLGSGGDDLSDGISSSFRYLFPEEFIRRAEETALAEVGQARESYDVDVLTLRFLTRTSGPGRLARARHLAERVDELVRWRSDLVGSLEGSPDNAEVLSALRSLRPGPLNQRDAVSSVLRHGAPSSIPRRVIIFGLSAIPGGRQFVDFVSDLAAHVEVAVYLCVPSLERAQVLLDGGPIQRSALDEWHVESDESLLVWSTASGATWRFIAEERPNAHRTLDGLQRAIRGRENDQVMNRDDTVRFIDCVGAARQCELIRDVIFDAIANSDVELRDVVVVVPDLERYAPLLERHWAQPRLPFDLLESTVARDSRLNLSFDLLGALGNYATFDQVAELMSHRSVADRLGLSDAERRRLWDLIESAPVSFATSAQDRARLGFSAQESPLGTWESLFDRVACASLYPVAAENSVESLGRADDAETVARLEVIVRLLDREREIRSAPPRPVELWIDTLLAWIDEISDVVDGDGSLERATSVARRSSGAIAGDHVTLNFEEFSSWWRTSQSAHTVQRSLSGAAVAVATPASLRCAPYKMVCLLGLDEESLPAPTLKSDFLRERRPGDPDPRRSMNGALLSAVLAATERVVVTFSGRDEDSGERLEPSIAVSQLVGALDAWVDPASIVERSSRHGFAVSSRDRASTTSYDARFGALPLQPAPGSVPGMYVRDRLSTRRTDQLDVFDLDTLRRFLRSPVREMIARTIGASTPFRLGERVESIPIGVDAVVVNRYRQRYLDELVVSLEEAFAVGDIPDYVARDHAPSTSCEQRECAWLCVRAREARESARRDEAILSAVPERLWRAAMNYERLTLTAYNMAADLAGLTAFDAEAKSESGTLELGDDRQLRLPGNLQLGRRRSRGDATLVVRVGVNEDLARDLLTDAVDLLVLATLEPDAPVELVRFSPPSEVTAYLRATGAVPVGRFRLNPRTTLTIDAGSAARALKGLVELADSSTRTARPLFRRTSTSLALASRTSKAKAESAWLDDFRGYGESLESANRLVYPLSFDELADDTAEREVIDEIRACLRDVTIQVCSSSKRHAPRALLERGRDAEAWRQRDGSVIEPSFEPLIEEPS